MFNNHLLRLLRYYINISSVYANRMFAGPVQTTPEAMLSLRSKSFENDDISAVQVRNDTSRPSDSGSGATSKPQTAQLEDDSFSQV